MTKRGIFITTGISILSITGIFIAANRSRKKKMIEEINEIIDKGRQESGDISDLAKNPAFDINFWKKYYPKSNMDKSENAKFFAKKIFDSVGALYDNEDEVVKTIAKVKSKSTISAISSAFTNLYGKSLGDFIVQEIDKGNNLQQIESHIKSLPNLLPKK